MTRCVPAACRLPPTCPAAGLDRRTPPPTALQVPHGLWLRGDLVLLQVWVPLCARSRMARRGWLRCDHCTVPLMHQICSALPQDRPPIKKGETWDDHHCDSLYVPQVLNATSVTVPGFIFNASAA